MIIRDVCPCGCGKSIERNIPDYKLYGKIEKNKIDDDPVWIVQLEHIEGNYDLIKIEDIKLIKGFENFIDGRFVASGKHPIKEGWIIVTVILKINKENPNEF